VKGSIHAQTQVDLPMPVFENMYFTFFFRFQKRHFLRFLEMTCRKVVSKSYQGVSEKGPSGFIINISKQLAFET